MNSTDLCKLCNKEKCKYVCPRCNVPYCSLPCYQSPTHAQCSESFYRDCVVEQIKSDRQDTSSQKNMVEILQRVQQIDNQLEDEDVTDSDDESEEADLADRLAGIDLDNADMVWEKLSEEEKRQFEELLKSGDVSEVVPTWEPWWLVREKKQLVKDLENNSETEEDPETILTCPPVLENVLPLSKLMKAAPSPCVRWCVVNVLAAYTVTARVYNGDHCSAAVEATATFVTLSGSLATNQLFQDPESAVAAVHLAASSGNCLAEGVDEHQLKDDVQKLVEGPSALKHSHYVMAALSDIHTLLKLSKCKSKGESSKNGQGAFSQRFPNPSVAVSSKITSTDLNKYLKKVEFYLSWTNEYF